MIFAQLNLSRKACSRTFVWFPSEHFRGDKQKSAHRLSYLLPQLPPGCEFSTEAATGSYTAQRGIFPVRPYRFGIAPGATWKFMPVISMGHNSCLQQSREFLLPTRCTRHQSKLALRHRLQSVPPNQSMTCSPRILSGREWFALELACKFAAEVYRAADAVSI